MKNINLIKLLFWGITLLFPILIQAQTDISYGKKGLNVTMELEWTANNYGDIQWQRSTDNGITWTDIAGATSPSYVFRINADGLYRVRVDGDKACDPFFFVREIKAIDFSVDVLSTTSTSVECEVSNADFKGAEIVEYGYCLNYSDMNRGYMDMQRIKIGEQLTPAGTFTIDCNNLESGASFSLRLYFKTADGSLLFGPGKIVKTLAGLKWATEDWLISKNEIQARFEIPGFESNMGNPNVVLKFGKDQNSLQTISCTKNADSYSYTSDLINGLEPGTEYIAKVQATIEGETQELAKTVKTLSDYSNLVVDETVNPVKHTIRWDATKTLHQISPEGLQTEYPRIIRVSADTLLCAYHGGSGSDYWVNIYLQKSYDNGQTWTPPTIIMDRENSSMRDRYWRFTNPEMIKLQNGWVVMSLTANGRPETNENCHVLVVISKDGGQTWGDPIIVGRGRTWEPMIVQLPDGELELYVSSEAQWWEMSPQPNPLPQEILFSRSTDNGLTWTEFKRASYSPGRRDGMPSAVILQGNKGIIFAIEIVNDYGFGSPSIVKRKMNEEWDETEWNGVESANRWKANINGHGGAPYMIQLPTGEIVVSAHTGGAGVWQTSRPRIIVGDNTGHNFTTPVSPLAVSNSLPADEGAYYNSLFLKDDETVWLVITHSKYDGNTRIKGEIKYLEGKIVQKQ